MSPSKAVVRRVATIANGASKSNAISLPHSRSIVGIELPSGWTAADVGIEVSRDNTTFVPVIGTGGTAVSLDAAVSTYIPVDPNLTRGAGWAKIISIAAAGGGAAVNQGAERIVQVYTRYVE